MGAVKLGADQMSKPAPLGYRRFSNAMIIIILPGLSSLVSGWGLAPTKLNRILLVLTFISAAVKGFGIFLGNGQVYTPTNAAVDGK